MPVLAPIESYRRARSSGVGWAKITHMKTTVATSNSVNVSTTRMSDPRQTASAWLHRDPPAFETNTLGAYRVMQALAPGMRDRGYGRIVNVSSGLGQLNDMLGGYPAYRVSKAGLNAFAGALAYLLAPYHVDAALAPRPPPRRSWPRRHRRRYVTQVDRRHEVLHQHAE